MSPKLSIITLFRSPVKTILTFLLLFAVSFALFSRVGEYAASAQEFARMAEGYRGIGLVEAAPPEFIDIRTPFYVTGSYYNPDHPDGTWEDTRYKALTAEQMDAIVKLPYVASTPTRYMTAGISKHYMRRDSSTRWYNYAQRYVFETDFGAENMANTYSPSYMNFDTARQRDFTFESTNAVALTGKPLGPDIFDGHLRVWFFTVDHEPSQATGERIEDLAYWLGEPHNSHWVDWQGGMYLFNSRVSSISTGSFGPNYSNMLIHGDRYVVFTNSYIRLDSHFNRIPIFYYDFFVGDAVAERLTDLIIPLKGQPDNYLETEAFAGTKRMIDIINADHHTLDVVYTRDTADIQRFNDVKMAITDGRGITPEDDGKEVCVINRWFAMENGLKVGDILSLGLCDKLFDQHAGLGAVAYTDGRYATPVKDVELEIVGIYTDFDTTQQRGVIPYWSYSDNTVFVPLSLLPESANVANVPVKPGAFSVVVKAQDISAFLKKTAPKIADMGLTMHFSDGGWPLIEKEYLETQRVSLIAIAVLLGAVFAANVLVTYLFILQRKREYAIMRATGCEKWRANRALLLPLMVVAAAAVLSGSVAAWINTSRSISVAAAEGASVPVPLALGCIVGNLAFLLAAAWIGLWRVSKLPLLTLLQAGAQAKAKTKRMTKSSTAKTGKAKDKDVAASTAADSGTPIVLPTFSAANIPPVPSERKQSALKHVSLYTLRNIRRTWLKSALSILVAAALFAAVGQFAAVRQATKDLYVAMPIKAIFAGEVDNFTLSRAEYSELLKNPYYEYSSNILFNEKTLTTTNDLERFYKDTPISITYAEGYGPDNMHYADDPDTKLCVLFDDYMDELGVALGDTVPLFAMQKSGPPQRGEYTVIGRAAFDTERTMPADVLVPPGKPFTTLYGAYTQVEYTIVDNFQIGAFREYLAEYLPSLNTGTLIFYMNTEELEKVANNIRLFDVLFPIVAAILALTGGLLAGLMLMQSAKEASLLRALGTTKRRTRSMLAGRQLLLCVVGSAIGLALLVLYNGSVKMNGIAHTLSLCAGVNGACYLVAILAGAFVVTRRNVLELLQTKE